MDRENTLKTLLKSCAGLDGTVRERVAQGKLSFEELAETEPLYAQFPDEAQLDYIRRLVGGIGEHEYELDGYIEKYAIGWKFHRIPRIATAIMRVAMYETMYMPEIPTSAAINEAVELAKGYEDQMMVSFINGILGSFVKKELPDEGDRS